MQLCVARSTNKTMVGRFCGTARVKHLEETFEEKYLPRKCFMLTLVHSAQEKHFLWK